MNIKKKIKEIKNFKEPDLVGLSVYTFTSNAHYKNRKDLLLIKFDKPVSQASLYTKSSCPSVPVGWAKNNLKDKIRGLLVNSGNANAFTGRRGEEDLDHILNYVAEMLNCEKEEVAVSSTGVIGEFLNTKSIVDALSFAKSNKGSSWLEAAEAIMTTDTFPKLSLKNFFIDKSEINILGIAKGSGMIEPNMGTMLSYIFTDANVDGTLLKSLLIDATKNSFNSITVDGETSTSDTVMLISTNEASNDMITKEDDPRINLFRNALNDVATDLAKQIVQDGEGATKFVEIIVSGAKNKDIATNIAKSVANSPLVKTAIYGEDPNWGRVIAAIGKSYEEINHEALGLFFGEHKIISGGMALDNYNEEIVKQYMKKDEIQIIIDLGMGSCDHTVWTCDFSHKYIDINTDYRS
ncbi:MAG: bifunctional glutamate N-acetyltransferase/amino-acid acetyltransferase ArgJ [Pseudomonadota bacterium]|nr:bifunctional glutamate N-acetyltransferase/amino-acid acetyltransferase ArgJ [Pseudomonadota bacterium]